MAGVKKTVKGIEDRARGIGDELFSGNPLKAVDDVNPIKGIEDAATDVESTFTPDIPEPEEETIIPIPDQSSAELAARRRRAKKVGTGRDSTILTEGLGG